MTTRRRHRRRRTAARGLVAAAALGATVGVTGAARAQTAPPVKTSPPITKNDFGLEFFQGPLLAPIHVTALGGAYTAYGEGVEGGASNAAAPSVREPFSVGRFDYDIDLGVSFPDAYADTDFDNRGDARYKSSHVDRFYYANAGLQMQLGQLGASLTGEFLQYALTSGSGDQSGGSLRFGRFQALASYGLAGNQVAIGGGVRGVALQLLQEGGALAGRSLLTTFGIAPEIGTIVKPDNTRWRLGATVRGPAIGNVGQPSAAVQGADGVLRVGGLVLPSRVVLPWEVEIGVALQVGPRPLNPPWIDPDVQERPVVRAIQAARAERAREAARILAETDPARVAFRQAELAREDAAARAIEERTYEDEKARLLAARRARYVNWPRERILLLASVLATGPSPEAVALEGFFRQERELVGRTVSLSPRFGVESEPIVDRVRAQIGSYVEPSRFDDGSARQHFTFGGSVKLVRFSPWGIFGDQVWELRFASDLAPRYTNLSVGFGAWH